MNCLRKTSGRQNQTRNVRDSLALREEMGKGILSRGKTRQNAHRWELLRLLKERREEYPGLGLGFYVPKRRRTQRVEIVKTFEAKPWTDCSALFGIWAFTVQVMGNHCC